MNSLLAEQSLTWPEVIVIVAGMILFGWFLYLCAKYD